MLHEITIIIAGLVILGIIVFLVSKNWRRSLQVMSGWGIYEVFNFSLDYILWPVLQALYGFIGIIILILITLVVNFTILMWYQKKKVDWFGVNEVEQMKAKGHLWVHEVNNHQNLIKRFSLYIPAKMLQFMIWLLNKNDIFAFVTLSVLQDSFITTIFLRHSTMEKLDKRDYFIFVTSTIFGCLGWSVLMQVIIMTIKAISGLF